MSQERSEQLKKAEAIINARQAEIAAQIQEYKRQNEELAAQLEALKQLAAEIGKEEKAP